MAELKVNPKTKTLSNRASRIRLCLKTAQMVIPVVALCVLVSAVYENWACHAVGSMVESQPDSTTQVLPDSLGSGGGERNTGPHYSPGGGSDPGITLRLFNLSLGFISIIVAMVTWIGVKSVIEIMEIRSKVEDKLHELRTEVDEAKRTSERVDDAAKFNQSILKDHQRIVALVEIQAGMPLSNRIAAAQQLSQILGTNAAWKFFEKIRKELSQDGIDVSSDPDENANRSLLIALLEFLSDPRRGKSQK